MTWIKEDGFNGERVRVPGDASQVRDNIEEIILWHFAEAWVLWEGDDGGAFLPSPSCNIKT